VGGILLNQNYGKAKRQNFVLSQREFRVPKTGQSVYEE